MVSRAERTRFSEWWWTVDRYLLAGVIALMFGGIILSLAASPAVAEGSAMTPSISSNAISLSSRRR